MTLQERTIEKREFGSTPFFQVDVIADYGGGRFPDHAFNEVETRLRSKLGSVENACLTLTSHPVHAFATIETGFWIAQQGLENPYPGLIVFSNTAPRGEDEEPNNAGVSWQGDEKQPFVFVQLDNGIPVFAVHAGYNLSFIKERAREIRKVSVPNVGTQFRSRDIYSAAVAAYIQGDLPILGGELIDPRTIPDAPQNRVATIDGYGNLKTTIRRSDVCDALQGSPFVEIICNGRRHFAVNTLSGVKGEKGQLCLNVGSSGGKEDPFLEVIRMKQRAHEDFRITELSDDLSPITIKPLPRVIFAETQVTQSS